MVSLDGLLLRRARVGDTAAITACVNVAYAPYIARLGKAPAPMRDDYTHVIKEQQVFVIEASGTLAGVLVLSVTNEGMRLDNVAVAPQFQGQGIGKRLLQHAELEAQRQGFPYLFLYTNEKMLENRALYARIGYVEYDRRIEDGYARVYMRKNIDNSITPFAAASPPTTRNK